MTNTRSKLAKHNQHKILNTHYTRYEFILKIFEDAHFPYSLKTSENQRFYDAFSGYRNGALAWNRFNILKHSILKFIKNFHFAHDSSARNQISKKH